MEVAPGWGGEGSAPVVVLVETAAFAKSLMSLPDVDERLLARESCEQQRGSEGCQGKGAEGKISYRVVLVFVKMRPAL